MLLFGPATGGAWKHHWWPRPKYGMRYRDLTEAASDTLYHVTFAARLPKIRSEGIVPGKRRNWQMQLTGKMYGDRGFVYLFTTEESAVRWAFKMNYEFKKDVVILVLKNVEGELIDDDSGEAYLTINGAGTWKRTQATVPASCIERVIPYHNDMARKLVAITNGKHDGSSLFEEFSHDGDDAPPAFTNPTDAVVWLRDRYEEERNDNAWSINRGQCYDFSEDLEAKWPHLFQSVDTGCIMKYGGQHNDEPYCFDEELLAKHWPDTQPWDGETWDDMFKHMGGWPGVHCWAFSPVTGLCYDIEHPEGIKNPFHLSFFNDWKSPHPFKKKA